MPRVSKSIRLNNVAIRRVASDITATAAANEQKRSLCAHAVVVLSRGQMQFRRRIVKIEAPQSALPAPIYMWVLCSCQFHLLSDHSHYAGMHASGE